MGEDSESGNEEEEVGSFQFENDISDDGEEDI